jgi:predicted MFS family arabinose efflux permease
MFGLVFLSFAIFWASVRSLAGIALGVLVMDIAVQAGHLSNQTRIFRLMPEARSRVQTVYMFLYFVGGALGSLIGSWAWDHYGWEGVCVSSMGMMVAGGLLHWAGRGKAEAAA